MLLTAKTTEPPRRRMRRRTSGTSLIEAVAVMSANAALVAVAVVTLVAMGRADRESSMRLDQQRTLSQMTNRMQEDAHAAQSLAWDEDAQTLCLTSTDKLAIIYQGDKEQWTRHTASRAVPGPGAKRELTAAYRLPLGLRLALDPANADAGQQVRITCSTTEVEDAPRQTPVRSSELLIQVGRDERLLHE